MLQLTQDDIYLNQQADNKQDAIKQIAYALTEKKYVEEGYVNGMLERESQAATYLGSGIAIPHGTTTTRHLVKKTGVQVFCFPEGVAWGDDGEKAYIAIGIAASSDEHLTLLRQLTHVLGDDDIETRIKEIQTKQDAITLLTGKKDETDDESVTLNDSLLLLDIPADDLATLQALNASRLKYIKAIDTQFVINALDNKPYHLGNGVWLNDSHEGNLKNAIVISRVSDDLTEDNLPVKMLLTIASKNDAINPIMNRLASLSYHQQLSQLVKGDKTQILSLLMDDNPQSNPSKTNDTSIIQEPSADDATQVREFIIINPNGIHTRPASMLVKITKEFNSKISIANLDGTGKPVSATSLMKIVTLGAKKGHRLQVIAKGEDALQALDAIGQAIADGFGEGTE